MSEGSEVLFKVQTKWSDLNIPVLVALSSSWWIGEQLITHPLEVIRTRLQVNNQKFSLETVKNLFKGTGVKGMYTAFWPGTLGYLPGNGAYLVTYSYLKDYFQSIHNKNNPNKSDGRQVAWVSFTSAALADFTAVSLYCPVEVVVQRLFLQDQNNKLYKNSFDAVRKIAASEGLSAFYKGFFPVLLNSIPASAIWWTIYESSKAVISQKMNQFKSMSSSKPLKTSSTISSSSNSLSTPSSASPTSSSVVVVEKEWLAELLAGALGNFEHQIIMMWNCVGGSCGESIKILQQLL
eukprot:TRINITY_DN4141_c0_g1_i4.p1 TRINITY_DN4141_c0_g1~~TRINITY_DN4141_c0_g1_i4.p1  ORF type:complete len:293 (+),score=49.94 TRINITY_DN4141_c0_g1_i4:3-881(+)